MIILFMGLPAEFDAALKENIRAREKFNSLSRAEKELVVTRAESIGTRHEMKSFVRSLVDSTGF